MKSQQLALLSPVDWDLEREAHQLLRGEFPVDATAEQLVEQAKLRDRERRARKRRERGIRTREAYLAKLASKPKPWIAEGVSRRTWERRRKALSHGDVADQKSVSQRESEIIVFKQRTYLASPNVGDLRKEGHQEGVLVEPSKQTETDRVETNETSSPELRTDLATNSDPRLAALRKWGRAAALAVPKPPKHHA
jgi:hypothetical protein